MLCDDCLVQVRKLGLRILTLLPRVGLVEVRAYFWGCMIKSPENYRVFVLLELGKAKRTNFLKDVGMVSVNPKRHKHPSGVTTALAVVHVLESKVLGATAL